MAPAAILTFSEHFKAKAGADLVADEFGAPNKLAYKLKKGPPNRKCEHPNHKMAMVVAN